MNFSILLKRPPMAVAFVTLGLLLFLPGTIDARSLSYDSYNVTATINKDSTVQVIEEMNMVMNGLYNGVTRGVRLNQRATNECNSSFSCGGFDKIILEEVKLEGDVLNADEYENFEQEDEDTNERFFVVRKRIWDGETNLSNEDINWSVGYNLIGSLGFDEGEAIFYWNMLPEDRGGPIESSTMQIIFPSGYMPTVDRLQVYSNYNQAYEVSVSGDSLIIQATQLPLSSDFTVFYRMPVGVVTVPASLTYTTGIPIIGAGLIVDGIDFGAIGRVNSIPAGSKDVEIYYSGYNSYLEAIDFEPGSDNALEISLEPGLFITIVIILTWVLGILGIFLIPYSFWSRYQAWRKNGKDADKAAAVIPIFKPEDGIKPYQSGAIIDETVDARDFVSMIIDLAYKGYIKIKEIKPKKDYELILLKDSDDSLDDVEEKVLTRLFNGKKSVTTSKMKSFYTDYLDIVNSIYRKMVSNDWFDKNPKKTRQSFYGIGVGLIGLGMGLTVFGTLIWVKVFGIFSPVTIFISLITFGIATLIFASHMPAKTALGSKVLNNVLGFKMYLNTAERYRLKDLKPEEFERYLSFAVALGVEKQWADSFKDIYKQQPDWLESSSNDALWNAYFITRFTNSFSSNISSSVITPPSGSGSGWSGGGGGGFSGGGGGGGFSGGF